MSKINDIIISNFKFFSSEEKIQLGGKHLLLYGENGSGKSSLYWGLYTLLRASIQSPNEVTKYFSPFHKHEDSLVNIYAPLMSDISSRTEHCQSYIQIIDDNSKVYSLSLLDTSICGEMDAQESLKASDFINYKALFKFQDFGENEINDLGNIFEKSILPYITFAPFTINGKNLTNAWQMWLEYKFGPGYTFNRNGKQILVYKNSAAYRDFLKFEAHFNAEFEKLIDFINTNAKIQFTKLGYDMDFQLVYIRPSHRKKDKYYYSFPFKIELKITKYNGVNVEIKKPHVFLNEAKLSALATAIKLSISDYRISSAAAPDCLKILVLDDIMISMDMSNRDVVLDIILEKANDYQIILMTHDRAFYNLIKSRLINRKINNSWVYREMYQFNNQNILKPIIINPKSYLDVAYKYMMDCDYPASANYMRKECERILGEILPKDKVFIFPDIPDLKGQIETVDAGGEKVYQLQNLIANFISFCLETGINVSEYQKILEFKDMLLNPLSHNNFNTPIYRRELIECYNILLKLNELNAQIEKKTIGDNGDKFNLRFSDDTNDYVYTFHLQNLFYKYKLHGQNIWRNEPYGSMSWEDTDGTKYIRKTDSDPITIEYLKEFMKFFKNTFFKKIKPTTITNMSGDWTNIWDVAYIINDDGSETLLKDL